MNAPWKVLFCVKILLCFLHFSFSTESEVIDGAWTSWSVYGTACSKTCGGGEQKRVRTCANPKPMNGGKTCVMENNEEGTEEYKFFACNTEDCFANQFTEWEDCENCTIGKRTRHARCGPNPEDVCTGAQAKVEEEDCNRWNMTICPSPCENVKAPEYGVCEDRSTEEEPKFEMICTMGYTMNEEKTACIRPPPTPPTKRPIPTLAPVQKTVATVVSKTASVLLIIFVGVTLALFLLLRIFTSDRIIQMNMEIALILAHCFLMFPPTTYENVFLCKLVSALIHFFFTACFCFMMLEALLMYSLVAYVVKSDGMLGRLQNIVVGWGLALIIVLFCICFAYEDYGGEYHCWLNMDSKLMLGEMIPISILAIVTLTLTEAAGAADYKPLKGLDKKQLRSAQISQRSNLIILFFVIAHMLTGMYSEYEQNLGLYSTFAILNGVTGALIFFFHCSGNQMVRAKLHSCYKSMTNRS